MIQADRHAQLCERARRFSIRKAVALFVGLSLPIALSDCGLDLSGACAPHLQGTIEAPDGKHVAQEWESICGFPGATVTDLVSVTERPVIQPPWSGVFAFNEDSGGSGVQVSADWTDDSHLRITVNALGDVRESPGRIGSTMVIYALGSGADLDFARSQVARRVEERREWERLKTSASWHYVENSYEADAYIIDHLQKFIEWAKRNATPRT